MASLKELIALHELADNSTIPCNQNLTSDHWQAISIKFSEEVASPVADLDAVETLTTVLRLIQRSCSHSTADQDRIIRSGLHHSVATLCFRESIPRNLARRCVMTLSNMVTSNAKTAAVVLPVVLRRMSGMSIFQDKDTVIPALVFFRNALKSDERLSHSVLNQAGLVSMLVSVHDDIRLSEEDELTVCALQSALLGTLVEGEALPSILKVLRSKKANEGKILQLWGMLKDECLAESLPCSSESSLPAEIAAELELQISHMDRILQRTPAETVAALPEWRLLALQVASLAAVLSNERMQTVQLARSEVQAAMVPVVRLLGFAHVRFPRAAGGRMTTEVNQPLNMKRDCISVITNLSYGNKDLQNQVRTLGGLGLVLAQCNIDEANPYLKEYATMCMRTLLENNRENQAEVEAMTPIGTEQTPQLREVGLQSKLFADGKVILEDIATAAQGTEMKITSINDEDDG